MRTANLRGHLRTQPLGDGASWCLALTAYALGEFDDEALGTSVRSGSRNDLRERACQGCYFTGLRQLVAGRQTEAIDSFRKAHALETRDYFEYGFAAAELKALGASP
ncbi:MAG: hypothetical protein WDN28_09530 [Chthoniobacter sp.]